MELTTAITSESFTEDSVVIPKYEILMEIERLEAEKNFLQKQIDIQNKRIK